jgi:hypothetical protein
VLGVAVAAISLVVAGTSCTRVIVQQPAPVEVSRGHGPPPHAPAHGYRAKNRQGAELVFDSGIGVYVVVGLPGVYFWSDLYYREARGGSWERCDRLDGAWIAVGDTSLPPGLRDKKASKSGPPGKARGHGPASRAD